MPNRGGKRPNAGRKNKGLSKDTVYIAVSKAVRDQIRVLAEVKGVTIKNYIEALIEKV
jgi:hypothetical protein